MNIDKLFRLKATFLILDLFFKNIDKKYFVREISAKLNLDVAMVQRELVRLKKEHFLISETKGKNKYYAINEDNKFFNEMKSLFEKNAQEKKRVYTLAYEERFISRLTQSANANGFYLLRKRKDLVSTDFGWLAATYNSDHLKLNLDKIFQKNR